MKEYRMAARWETGLCGPASFFDGTSIHRNGPAVRQCHCACAPVILQLCAVDKAVDGEEASDFPHGSMSVTLLDNGISVFRFYPVVPAEKYGIHKRGAWQDKHCQRQNEGAKGAHCGLGGARVGQTLQYLCTAVHGHNKQDDQNHVHRIAGASAPAHIEQRQQGPSAKAEQRHRRRGSEGKNQPLAFDTHKVDLHISIMYRYYTGKRR